LLLGPTADPTIKKKLLVRVDKEEARIAQARKRIAEARKTDSIDFSVLRPLSRDTHFMESLKNYQRFCQAKPSAADQGIGYA
jgi:biotin synthase-related radical SAM superfamily protein